MSNGVKRGSTFYLVVASSPSEREIDPSYEIPAVFSTEDAAISYAASDACRETGEADIIRCVPVKVIRDTRVTIRDYPAMETEPTMAKSDE